MQIKIPNAHELAGASLATAGDPDQLLARLLWHHHTSYAHVVCATLHGEVIAGACGYVHGNSGWVREVFADPSLATDHERSAVLHALLTWMEEHGATSQLAIVPEGSEVFWQAHGFVADGALLHYHGGEFIRASKEEVVALEPVHMMAVLRIDGHATGEDREPLLREHAYLGSVHLDGTRVRGYSLPLLGHGLIVADAPEVGLELQRWLFPIQPYLLLPVGHLAAHAHLIARKYTATPAGIRMVRGARPAYSPQMIYAHM